MPTIGPTETRPTTAFETLSDLSFFDATPYQSGERAFVRSVQQSYQLRRDSVANADGFDILSVGPNSLGEGRWIRECFLCSGATGVTGPTGATGPSLLTDPTPYISANGFDTNGLTIADAQKAVYEDSTGVIQLADADSIATSLVVGFYSGTPGEVILEGILPFAPFTTVGGLPANGAEVYLSPASAEAGAAGKLTPIAPSVVGQVVAPVGIVLDNANWTGGKTARVRINLLNVTQL